MFFYRCSNKKTKCESTCNEDTVPSRKNASSYIWVCQKPLNMFAQLKKSYQLNVFNY